MELLIGDKLWSTWSMRAWLALKHTGAPFTETLIRLRTERTNADARVAGSPSGRVPVLKDGDLAIWDSIAICEYLAEKFPAARLWPADPHVARAVLDFFLLEKIFYEIEDQLIHRPELLRVPLAAMLRILSAPASES